MIERTFEHSETHRQFTVAIPEARDWKMRYFSVRYHDGDTEQKLQTDSATARMKAIEFISVALRDGWRELFGGLRVEPVSDGLTVTRAAKLSETEIEMVEAMVKGATDFMALWARLETLVPHVGQRREIAMRVLTGTVEPTSATGRNLKAAKVAAVNASASKAAASQQKPLDYERERIINLDE